MDGGGIVRATERLYGQCRALRGPFLLIKEHGVRIVHRDRIHGHPLCRLISIMSVAPANAKQGVAWPPLENENSVRHRGEVGAAVAR